MEVEGMKDDGRKVDQASALQRRIWLGGTHPLLLNTCAIEIP